MANLEQNRLRNVNTFLFLFSAIRDARRGKEDAFCGILRQKAEVGVANTYE